MTHTDYETWQAICAVAMLALPVIAVCLIVLIEVSFKLLDLVDWVRR